MKLLLTGSTGFVGRNLLLRLIEDERYEEIYLPLRSPEKLRAQLHAEGIEKLPRNLHLIQAEAPQWDMTVPEVDHVVHGAALLSGISRAEYFQVNLDGTRRLFERLPAKAKVVVLSSMAAVGPCLDGVDCRNESHPSAPVTWYGESKLAMEEMLAKEFGDRSYLCLRPPMVLGARDSASLALFKMARQPIRFKPGFRLKQYSYIAVSDLVTAILAALARDWTGLSQRSFFVGADDTVTDAQLIAESAKVMKRMGMTVVIPQSIIWAVSRVVDRVPAWRRSVPNLSADRAREIWPNRWVVSPEPFKKAFGWGPAQSFSDLVKETGEWYRSTHQL